MKICTYKMYMLTFELHMFIQDWRFCHVYYNFPMCNIQMGAK